MRTKTLLLTAALCAAGAAASMAQVYSVNVVGYINVATPANAFTLLANPLDNGTNDLNSLLGTMPNKSSVQMWNGVGFNLSTKGGSPSVWAPNYSVPIGTGFFLKTPTAQSNTFVGNVVSATFAQGNSVTNPLPNTQVLVGSAIPYTDDLNGTNILLSVLPNKSSIQVWNGVGFTLSTKGGSPSVWAPDLTITPAQGFFVLSKTATNWVQTRNF